MQDIRQEACYDSEKDEIFIPFKDSNRLFNDIFQDCVKMLFYNNVSQTHSYQKDNQIDKKENFWGPSRIRVTAVYQDKGTDKPLNQTEHITLNPDQVKSCSELTLRSTGLLITYILTGIIILIIIISLIFYLHLPCDCFFFTLLFS